MIREGSRIAYVGHLDASSPAIGDEGVVLADGGGGCHVRWATGARRGQITFVAHTDLVSAPTARDAVARSWDDALSTPLRTSARAVYDEYGPKGLLRHLSREGHLSAWSAIAAEALQVVASRVRSDPSVLSALAELDDDDAETFVAVASRYVLTQAVQTASSDGGL